MPHVSIHYRIYLGAAHHRRPRNAQPWVEPYPSGEVDVVAGGVVTPFAPPTLPYTVGNTTVEPAFVFWSLSDGSGGRTQAARALTETVASSPLTLIAWYYLPAPGDPNGGGGTAVLIDAYSVLHGDFVDDDFVTVTSDGSLTQAANVDGVVPTTSAETVVAFGAIPTGEGFDEWVVASDDASAVGETLTAPAASTGIAIATYRHTGIDLPKVNLPREGVIVLFGVVDDAPGVVIPIGGGGGPVPIGPWGPFVSRILAGISLHGVARGLSKTASTRVRATADAEIAAAARELAAVAKKGFHSQ